MYITTFVCSLQHLNMYVFERFSLQHSKIRILVEQFFETRESKLNITKYHIRITI